MCDTLCLTFLLNKNLYFKTIVDQKIVTGIVIFYLFNLNVHFMKAVLKKKMLHLFCYKKCGIIFSNAINNNSDFINFLKNVMNNNI